MRIFPEGSEEWLEPSGTAMQTLAGLLLFVALGAFVFRLYQASTWSKVEGEVTSANLTRYMDDNGQTLCSAEYKVRYIAAGTPRLLATSFKTSTNDCAAWKRRVEQLPSSKVTILYFPQNPNNATVYSDNWFEFHLVSIVCVFLAVAFAIAGSVAKVVGSRMQQRGVKMP